MTREEWLAERRKGIGASDSPAILGLSPWRSPLEVWAEKAGLVEHDPSSSEAAEWGIRLEPVIAQALAEKTGREVTPWQPHTILRHPHLHWLTCTPDAIDDDGRVVQIKTASEYKAGEWKDGPPLAYQVQVQHEMAVHGAGEATLVVLIGGQRLRYYDVPRNDDFIEALIVKLAGFWLHVQRKTMPTVDGSIGTARVLAKLHPQDNGETVHLDAELFDAVRERDEAADLIAAAEDRKRLAENRIRAAIGDASYGVLPNGKTFSLLTQTRKAHEVKEATFRVLREVKGKKQ